MKDTWPVGERCCLYFVNVKGLMGGFRDHRTGAGGGENVGVLKALLRTRERRELGPAAASEFFRFREGRRVNEVSDSSPLSASSSSPSSWAAFGNFEMVYQLRIDKLLEQFLTTSSSLNTSRISTSLLVYIASLIHLCVLNSSRKSPTVPWQICDRVMK